MSFIKVILDCGQQVTNEVYDEDQLKQRLHELEKVRFTLLTQHWHNKFSFLNSIESSKAKYSK